MIRWLSYLQWGATALVLLTASWWWRPYWLREAAALPDWIRSTDLYFLHYGFTPLIGLALLAWVCTGLRGLIQLASGLNLFWAMLVIQLALWALISVPPEVRNRMAAFSSGIQLLVVMLFALSILANPPPRRVLVGALVAGMIFQGMIGMAQVALQRDIGVHQVVDKQLGTGLQLYELNLDPARSGVSVVQSEGVRYLRPYGVGAHPNLIAGVLVMGCLAALSLPRRVAGWALVIGVWALLLTFSRSAIGGLMVGIGVWGVFTALISLPSSPSWRRGDQVPLHEGEGFRVRAIWQRGASVLIGALLLLIPFVGIYYPVLRVRSGVAEEGTRRSVEALSIASRAVYREQAEMLIRENPIRGIGIGNFSWESAWLLRYDWRDLRGDHVHNIYLLVTAELGLVGFALWGGAIGLAGISLLWRGWRGRLSMEQIGLLAGVVAWLAIGWFDHYPWTQFGYLVLFWGSLAGALAEGNEEILNRRGAEITEK